MQCNPCLLIDSDQGSQERRSDACPVARQPVLNLKGRLHAYELTLRAMGDVPQDSSSETAVKALLDDTLLFGLERFTNGFPAFVACSAESLLGQWVQVLPANLTILAIPERLDPVPSLVDACHKLKSLGFQLALDDYTGGGHPLLGLVDYVCVDFSRPAGGRDALRARLAPESATLMAKRLQTEEEYQQARREGFTLFQGDYLFRPALMKNRKVPANRLAHFEILRLLYRDPVDLRKLADVVMRDPSLAYRLLRLVNSPICALRQEVRSVESALIVVGIDTFRRFATLAILSDANPSQPPEVLQTAFLRGRFCELGARLARQDDSEQYLLGLFSLLHVMLRIPMHELTPSLPLREEVRHALEGAENRERCLLSWLENHENGEWDACDRIAQTHRINRDRLVHCYGQAVSWAYDVVRSSSETPL